MPPLTAFFLILLGVGLLFADIFIPTFGVMTLAGVFLIVWSVYSLFQVSALLGWGSASFTALALAASGWLGWKFFKRSPYFHRARIENEPLPDGEDAAREGDVGVTVTPLRPSGKVRVRGRVRDAISESGMVEAGAQIRVAAVGRGELSVREATEAEGPPGS